MIIKCTCYDKCSENPEFRTSNKKSDDHIIKWMRWQENTSRSPQQKYLKSFSNPRSGMSTRNMTYLLQILIAVIIVVVCLVYLPHQSLKKHTHPQVIVKYTTDSPSASLSCSSDEATLYYIQHEEAKCLDGTNPAYYFRPGELNSHWHIHFEGGGWCYDIEACYNRSTDNFRLGSSASYANCMSHDLKDYLSHDQQDNPLMYNWNHVLVKYCDGASYAGNTIQIYNNKPLYFKGMHNRDETIRHLLDVHGMSSATEIVISGCSAGGLGIYLGIDQMADIVHTKAPQAKLRAMSDSGFFPDYTSDEHWQSENEYPEALINNVMDYSQSMKNVFHFTNMSAGAHPACIQHNTEHPELCVFAEYLTPHINTPLFALQPRHDHWQIWHIVGKPFDYALINEFGVNITRRLNETLLSNPHHGAYFDSCIHHCTKCSRTADHMWHGVIKSTVEGYSEADAFQWWYNTKTVPGGRGMLFIQEGTYPCKECCNCVI